MRNALLITAAFIALAGVASAQFSEIPVMTVPNSHIDFDALPGGPTTLSAINAAGTGGGANIAALTLPVKAAAAGVYNTNPGYGNALGLVGGGLSIVVPPTGAFDAFTGDITLGMNSTEFGFSLGDWTGPGTLGFFDGATSLGTFTTTTWFGAAGNSIFVKSTVPFNRVTVDASTAGGNFVIPDLHVQIPEPAALSLLGIGALALLRRR